MLKNMSAPTNKQLSQGWATEEMKSVATTFERHGRLLIFLVQLGIIPRRYFSILQKDFEQKVWSKIRDGDDLEWQ